MPSLDELIKEKTIPEQKHFKGIPFPLVLSPNDNAQNNVIITSAGSTFDLIRNQRTKIEDQLLQHGAILFRGFPLLDAQDFHGFVEAFDWEPLPYVGGAAPRTKITERVFTANEMWFNSIIAAYKGWRDSRNTPQKAVTFADGTPMPCDVMDDLEIILDDLAVDVTWQAGDVFLVDNRQVLHARRPFIPPRQILASLVK